MIMRELLVKLKLNLKKFSELLHIRKDYPEIGNIIGHYTVSRTCSVAKKIPAEKMNREKKTEENDKKYLMPN